MSVAAFLLFSRTEFTDGLLSLVATLIIGGFILLGLAEVLKRLANRP